MTTTKAATHRGNCQICGALQKVPEGKMAKHGYSVRFGFFEGVCNGSGNLPFQISKGMIDAAIAWAEGRIAKLTADVAKLNEPATTNVGWVREYVPAMRRGEVSGDRWEQKAITMQRNQNPGGDYVWFSFHFEPNPAAMKINAGKIDFGYGPDKPTTEIEAATACNQEYAKRVIGKTIKELEQYVSWQKARIKDWKPADLIPIKGGK